MGCLIMESFKLEDLNCYRIDIIELSENDDQRSFEIWAKGYTVDKFDYMFYIGDACVAQIGKDVVENVEEGK